MNMNHRKNRMQRMGAINASSTAGSSDGIQGTYTPYPTNTSSPGGSDLSAAAAAAASLVASGRSAATGILQAEAAQNAINAQKNLTSALTPGVITIGLALVAFFILSKK